MLFIDFERVSFLDTHFDTTTSLVTCRAKLPLFYVTRASTQVFNTSPAIPMSNLCVFPKYLLPSLQDAKINYIPSPCYLPSSLSCS